MAHFFIRILASQLIALNFALAASPHEQTCGIERRVRGQEMCFSQGKAGWVCHRTIYRCYVHHETAQTGEWTGRPIYGGCTVLCPSSLRR